MASAADAPINLFKARLADGPAQIGFWLSMGDATAAEIAADCGYDWLLIDTEHATNTLREVVDQLRAIGGACPAIVRPRSDDRALIKQFLDAGAQTLLIPMIESAAQAAAAVAATRYPPVGTRGVAGAVRASAYGRRSAYLTTANDQVCVLLQVESRAGLAALDEILAVEGVDGVFIGPADLAADLGFPGRADAPEVEQVIAEAITRIRSAGMPAGILLTDPDAARERLDTGIDFLAVGVDTSVLRRALTGLRTHF